MVFNPTNTSPILAACLSTGIPLGNTPPPGAQVHTAITRISLVSDPKLAGGRSIPASGFPNVVGATDGISPVVTLATSINEGRSNSPSSDDTWSCSDTTLAPEDSAMTTISRGLWSNKNRANRGGSGVLVGSHNATAIAGLRADKLNPFK